MAESVGLGVVREENASSTRARGQEHRQMSLFKPDTKFEGGPTFVQRLGVFIYWVGWLEAGVLIIGFLVSVVLFQSGVVSGFIDIPDYITDWLGFFFLAPALAPASWATGRSFLWLLTGR